MDHIWTIVSLRIPAWFVQTISQSCLITLPPCKPTILLSKAGCADEALFSQGFTRLQGFSRYSLKVERHVAWFGAGRGPNAIYPHLLATKIACLDKSLV